MSAEQSILTRIEATITDDAPAPPRAAPVQTNTEDDDGLSFGPDDLDAPEPPALEGEDEPVDDSIELELGGELRKFNKAELKELAEAGQTFKQTEGALKEQRAAVAVERQANAQIAQLAPHIEALRAEGRICLNVIQGLNQEVQALMESDPIAAIQKQNQLQQYQGRFNQLAQAEGQASQQIAMAQAKALEAQVAAEIPVLLQKLPKWKDAAVRERDQKFIREYMTEVGYTPQEVALATRSHYIVTLLEAAKYRAIVKKQGHKKVDGAPQMARPGSVALPGQKASIDKLNYRKAIRAAKSDAEASKIVLKRIEAGI
jgi:hypothetical protein